MSEGPGQLQIVEGTINSDSHTETMKNYMLPSVGKNFIDKQNNALIILKKKKKTQQWFEKEDIEVLDWSLVRQI